MRHHSSAWGGNGNINNRNEAEHLDLYDRPSVKEQIKKTLFSQKLDFSDVEEKIRYFLFLRPFSGERK